MVEPGEERDVFVDKGEARLCEDCGEPLEVVRDYGVSGQALTCKICGFYVEEIDLHDTTLSSF